MVPLPDSPPFSHPSFPGAAAAAAFAFVAERHAGQRRESDGTAFVTHPVEVGELLHACGYPDHVVAAGLLHDVLERSDTTREELRTRFGSGVARLVESVTEDASIEDTLERNAKLRNQVAAAGAEAGAIFAADKVSKVRELRTRVAGDPAWAQSRAAHDKLHHYLASRSMLERRLGPSPLLRELSLALKALLAPPGQAPDAAPGLAVADTY